MKVYIVVDIELQSEIYGVYKEEQQAIQARESVLQSIVNEIFSGDKEELGLEDNPHNRSKIRKECEEVVKIIVGELQ